ncbi:unnamed protein product [Hapterophycus canaliculatus]
MKASRSVVATLVYGRSSLAWRAPFRMTAEIQFVTNTKCPYAQRTWIALEETNTAYEMKEVSLYGSGGKPGWFMDLNPKGEVPFLVVDGKAIVGSEETVDYLMRGELSPKATRWRTIVNDRLKPAGKRAVFSGGSDVDRSSLNAVLEDLDACLLDDSNGAEETFTAADASAFPFLQRVHGEFGFPPECRRLEAWYASACKRPGVRKTIKNDFWWWW